MILLLTLTLKESFAIIGSDGDDNLDFVWLLKSN